MARKGIILAGGAGTRLRPLTEAVSKQLLPVYDQPMIFYPVMTLMRAGIREILIISTPDDLPDYRSLLLDGSQWGVKFSYAQQPEPNGLAEAFIIGKKFIGPDSVCLVLGDNVFIGEALTDILKEESEADNAVIFGCSDVGDLTSFGVAEVDGSGSVLSIEEKPKNPKGKYAVAGLYFYPNDVVEKAMDVQPSERGEKEISTVNEAYRRESRLKLIPIPSDCKWMDTGTIDSLYEASQELKSLEQKVTPSDLAVRNGWIQKVDSANASLKAGRHFHDWRLLLSDARIRLDTVKHEKSPDDTDKAKREDIRSPFERDYQRVVFSAPFRRMAGKTQVQAFPDIDYVHNRLTHSVEVSAVARSLAHNVGQYLYEVRKDIYRADIESLEWIAQAGGVSHDIGNPPYGHAGEYAIQYWAKSTEGNRIFPDDPVWKDCECFDGNAQAFRLMCSEESRVADFFHLTVASLGGLVKYPWTADVAFARKKNKFNVFSTERDYFEVVWKKLGLKSERRHPLSYLSEAADDICYHILDFEDAVTSGIVDKKMVLKTFRKGLGLPICDQDLDKSAIQILRARCIHNLVDDFSKCFVLNYDKIMAGDASLGKDLRSMLDKGCPSYRLLDELDKLYKIVFTERRKVYVECGAYSQIPCLLNRYYGLLKEMFENGKSAQTLDFEKLNCHSRQLVVLAWGQEFYEKHPGKTFAWWMHAVLDYISGMTDLYVQKIADKLK